MAFPEFPPEAFAKQDSGDDLAFYAPPRMVRHIDDEAVAALKTCYRGMLPRGGRVLDMMSSCDSHLPEDLHFAQVIGHGMNAVELEANPRLTRWFVQNLNHDPMIQLSDHAFDAAMACVGVQYLQKPLAVFAEVRRVLMPGAPFIVSFSNRCFPTKAVAIWRALDLNGQAALVTLYFERAGFTGVSVNLLTDGIVGDPLVAVIGRA